MIGAVLTGGASTRFGADKAVADWCGLPLASRPMRALYGAGARQLVYVGDRRRDDHTFVLPSGAPVPAHVIDEHPGEGPLGAIVTVLRHVQHEPPDDEPLVVAACDLPNVTSETVAAMLRALSVSNADLVVPRAAGRVHWSLLALRWSTCVNVLSGEFARGTRAVHRAVASLQRVEVELSEHALINVNDRSMLPIDAPDR